MRAVLVTGMSGAGKSTVLAELAGRGVDTVDTDRGEWTELVDGEPMWRLTAVAELLDRRRARPLVVQGTVANQGAMYPRFDAVVLLTAPPDVLLARIRTRTTNDFGKRPGELERIAADIRDVEPLLRAGATHVVDTTGPLDAVVAEVERIVRAGDAAP